MPCTSRASTTEMHGKINRLVSPGILYTLWPEDTFTLGWNVSWIDQWSDCRLKCIIEGIYTGSPICKNATMCKCPLTLVHFSASDLIKLLYMANNCRRTSIWCILSNLYITCNWLRMNGMHEINTERESESSNSLQHKLDEIKHPGLHVWCFQTGKSGKDRVKYHI